MTATRPAFLHVVSTVPREPRRRWTDLGRAMGYTDTAAKRQAILRAAEQLDFTSADAHWRLRAPHLAAVAAAALGGAQLRRAARTEVPGHPGWALLVLDDVCGVRHILLDLGHEAIHLLRQHPAGRS